MPIHSSENRTRLADPEIWKDYRVLSRIRLHQTVNGLIYAVRHIPLIGKHLGDHYRFAGLKRLLDVFLFLSTLLVDVIKTLFVTGLTLGAGSAAMNVIPHSGNALVLGHFQASVYLVASGAFWMLYAMMPHAGSRVMSSLGEFYSGMKLYHLDPRRLLLVFGVLDPLLHFVSRTIVWMAMFSWLVPIWSVGESVLWSAALLLSEWALEAPYYRHDLRVYERRLKDEKYESWRLVIGMLLHVVVAALLYWLGYDLFWLGAILTLALIPFAWMSLRFYRGQTEFGLLVEKAVDQKAAIEQLGKTANRDAVKVLDEDIQTSTAERTVGEKTGYAMLNDLFFLRHRRLLLKPIRHRMAFGAVAFIILTGMIQTDTEGRFGVSQMVFFIPLAMYLLCSLSHLTRAMYLNCDQALLHYSFYKEDKALLAMFRLRAKSLLGLMLWPTGLVLLFVAGNGLAAGMRLPDLLAAGLLVMTYGLFFTVLPLFVYYVFFPYDKDGGVRSVSATIVNLVVYLFCVMLFPQLVETVQPLIFALISLAAFALLIPLAYQLILRRGPKAMRKEM